MYRRVAKSGYLALPQPGAKGPTRDREADLTGAQCQGACLRRADLSGAWLHQADLSGAELRGSDLTSLDPLTVRLKGAIIDPYQSVTIAASLGLQVQDD